MNKTLKKQFEIQKCVPYQLCPKCYGEGFVHPRAGYLTTPTEICNVCNGSKIIPMYVIPIQQ